MSTELIGKKLGMTQVFNADGNTIPITIIEAESMTVTDLKTVEKNGYNAVQMGVGKKKNTNKAEDGFYKKNKVSPAVFLKEFRVDSVQDFSIGSILDLSVFADKKFVDVSGITKGKGFQGAMKRHGFSGGPGGHGSHFHRSTGSIGMNSNPAHVFKGKKMPGHMGTDKVTVQNLEVFKVDLENKLLLVKGSIPGKNNGYVYIKESIKKKNQVK